MFQSVLRSKAFLQVSPGRTKGMGETCFCEKNRPEAAFSLLCNVQYIPKTFQTQTKKWTESMTRQEVALYRQKNQKNPE